MTLAALWPGREVQANAEPPATDTAPQAQPPKSAPTGQTSPTTTTPTQAAPEPEGAQTSEPEGPEPEGGADAAEAQPEPPQSTKTDVEAQPPVEPAPVAKEPATPEEDVDPSAGGTEAAADLSLDGGEAELGLDDELEGDLDDLDLEGLLSETVVASASRTAESSAEAPATTQVITGSDMQRFGIRTLDEAFNYLAMGIYAESTGSTGDVGVRGVTIAGDWGNHVLLVIDGHVVNDAAAGIVWLDRLAGIPMELVDRVEIILGPGSVLYGNNAMLGVISVVMKDGADIDGLEFTAEGSLSPNQNRYGNFEQFNWDYWGKRSRFAARYGKGFKLGKQDGAFVAQLEYMNDRTPSYVWGPQFIPELQGLFNFGDKTGSGDPNIWGGRARGRVQGPYSYLRFRLGDFTLSGRTSWLSTRNGQSSLTFNDGPGQTIVTSFVDARYDYLINEKISGLARVYFDHFLFRQDLLFSSASFCDDFLVPCTLEVDTESLRGGLESQWSFDWFADGSYATMVGVDGRLRDVTSRAGYADATGARESSGGDYSIFDQAVGVYAQQIMKVHPKVAINLGGRYDYFEWAQAFSPRGALILNAWKDGSLKAIYSQAFRAPSRTELQANQELDPEVVRSVELSLGQGFGRHRFTVAAFGTLWNDIIQRIFRSDPNNPGRIDIDYQNANQIWNIGGNFGYTADVKNWSWGINATYGWGRVRLGGFETGDIELSDDELTELGFSRQAVDEFGRNIPLGGSPDWTGNARLAYAFGEKLPTVAAVGRIMGPTIIKDAYQRPELLDFVDAGEDVTLPAKFSGRFTVSGDIRRWQRFGIGYRMAVDAITDTRTPTTVGPFRAYWEGDGTQAIELNQVPRLTVFGGLNLDFGEKK